MKTYKNTKFKRDYDCTNVKFIQTNTDIQDHIWQICDEKELTESNCEFLFSQEGQGEIRKVWGYL